MNIFVDGALPVAIKVIAGDKELKLKKFEMSTLTVRQALDLQSKLKPDQYTGIAEVCEQTKLVDESGNCHELSYEALMSSSSQNLNCLTTKKAELDAKEQAES
ncbi:hypothetical protein [Acinetobacter sp. TR11]|jgi:hypothetical protein|uniref:hypothetical protein n=1 Tax=Acinetobacter sp. TR11 TaxID=3003393 RepID=UPI0022AC1985|nr:hypothetical protein [Acinetobacter sp. TR11]WAU72902.1 hypothetical protein O1450_12525 [Acinetobacter sp. TR11]